MGELYFGKPEDLIDMGELYFGKPEDLIDMGEHQYPKTFAENGRRFPCPWAGKRLQISRKRAKVCILIDTELQNPKSSCLVIGHLVPCRNQHRIADKSKFNVEVWILEFGFRILDLGFQIRIGGKAF